GRGERLRAHPVDEIVEGLALLALRLVQTDPALDGLRNALGGEAHLHALPVGHHAALVAAADLRDVVGDLPIADLYRRASDRDRAEVVLAAAVGAAGHLDVDPPGERILDAHRP